MALELNTTLERASTTSVTVPTAGVTAGELILNGSVYGFALQTAPDTTSAPNASSIDQLNGTDLYTFVWKADSVTGVKATGYAPVIGDKAYIDTTTAQIYNTTATGRVLVGYFMKAQASADTTCEIAFDGSLSTLV